ncbi:MAG: hypothetical protein V1738_06075, partial [Patescibacteria group bacterium]
AATPSVIERHLVRPPFLAFSSARRIFHTFPCSHYGHAAINVSESRWNQKKLADYINTKYPIPQIKPNLCEPTYRKH